VDGPEVNVALPSGLPKAAFALFGPEGRTIYIPGRPRSAQGLKEIQFGPLRERSVPGTEGFDAIWHFTVSQPSGKIFISGKLPKMGECGTVEVDPSPGTTRKVLAGAYPDCGGGGGAVSPDGKRALTYAGNELGVIDLESRAVEPIRNVGGGIGLRGVTWGNQVAWSPDGRWISAIIDQGKILLIDASDTSRRRRLGSSGRGFVVWSPDSKYLLIEKSQLRCGLTYGFFESLEVLEVATGKRAPIKSSRCNVGVGSVGWLDPGVVR
jgi:WD40 repeat protein